MKLVKRSHSLSLRLTLFISSILLIACFTTISFTYFDLRSSLRQVFDNQQLLFAKRLAAFNMHGRMMKTVMTNESQVKIKNLDYDDDALAFAIFNRNGQMITSDGENGENFYFYGGFFPTERNRAIINEEGKWRILWLLSNDNQFVIAVGQKLDYQQELLASLLFKQLIPWFITFIITIIFIIAVINRSFVSIKLLAKRVTLRKSDDASPIDTQGVPKEIVPFVAELNNLFARISLTINRERQFISDAAHELRTPLTALRIQTEVAQLSMDDQVQLQHALVNLLHGIDRSTHLVEQLLTLSRLDTLEIKNEIQSIDWCKTAQYIKDELTLLLQQKQINFDIIVNKPQAPFSGHPLLLTILLRNLVNNALRYIPAGATIWLTINHNIITIEDNGNGVDDEVLLRLGERFYRPAGQEEEGSGLGLSIVKKIAELHNITVKFANREQGGFKVILTYL